MTHPLTERQTVVLNAIRAHWRVEGCGPSYRIAAQFFAAWGRWPHLEELQGVFDFCMGQYRREGRYVPPRPADDGEPADDQAD